MIWTVVGYAAITVVFLYKGWQRIQRQAGVAPDSKKLEYKVVQQVPVDAKKAQVLVTGGCGFLGGQIIDLILERFSDRFQLHVLDAGAKPDVTRPTVTYIQGDIQVASHVMNAVRGKTVVMHCAAIIENALTKQETMQHINVQGTLNVVEACLEHEVRALVYTSSVAVVYGKSFQQQDQTVTEDMPLPDDKDSLYGYSKTKKQAERIVLAANGHVVKTVALRPGGILGVGDKFLSDLFQTPGTPVVGHESHRVPYVWGRDLARAHVMALIKLLYPTDSAMHCTAAQPWWCPATAWDAAKGSAWGHSVLSDPLGAKFAAQTDAAVQASLSQSIAGKALFLLYGDEPGNRYPRHREVAGGPVPEGGPVNAYGLKPQGTVPLWLALQLARVNELFVRLLGIAPIDALLTVPNVEITKRSIAFDITRAKTLLGWQPVPWRASAAVIAAERRAKHEPALTVQAKKKQ